MQGTMGTLVTTEMNVANELAYPFQGEIILKTTLVKMKGDITVSLTHHLVNI